MPRNKKSLAEAVSAELKSGFNLDSFKNKISESRSTQNKQWTSTKSWGKRRIKRTNKTSKRTISRNNWFQKRFWVK